MQIQELGGKILEIASVAAVAAAFVVLLLQLAQKTAAPALPQRNGWFTQANLRVLLLATLAAVGSRLLLVGLTYLVIFLAKTFGGQEVHSLFKQFNVDPDNISLQTLFSHWDAPHYLDIAKYGYTSDLAVNHGEQHWFIVFYPLYPALIALIKPFFSTQFSAGMFLAWACLAGACYWIYKLALLDVDKNEARRAVKYLLIFPAAVFLGAPYTESLFLLLTALCFYALRKRCWFLAGFAGFFAALTRNLGALLVVPFLVELLDSLGVFADRSRFKTRAFWLGLVKNGLWAVLIPLAVGVYLLINKIVYGDPFMFLFIQDSHWYQHSQPFMKTVLTSWDMLTGLTKTSEKAFLWGPQLVGIIAVLAVLPVLMKRLRPSYAAFLLVYVVVVLSPSNLLSFNRYMMGAVPFMLGLAKLTRRKWVDFVLTTLFVLLMLYFAAGYICWQMVV